jgi:metal-responsive CopG/Arc/MetJ family transcriptional regulator
MVALYMTALSIVVPDELALNSSLIAKKMHISRSQFIRLAIENEIKAYQLMREQQEMVVGFRALKQQASYLDEINDIEQLDVHLKDEGDFWWKK